MSGYQPGTCNIGHRQRVRRAAISIAAFLAAGVYMAAYVLGYLPGALLVGVFIPLVIGFEWGIQAYESFCVRLAFSGEYDFQSESGGEAGEVTSESARRADRLAAAKITAAGIGLAAVTTVVLVMLV